MFNYKMKVFLSAMVLSLVGVIGASAQFPFGSQLKVTIPNEFVVQDKLFPAGEYTIAPTPSTSDSSSFLVLRGEGKSMIFDTIGTESANAATTTHLVFDVVDGTRFLSKIWLKGEIAGNEILKSKMEKRMIAANKPVQQVVVTTGPSL